MFICLLIAGSCKQEPREALNGVVRYIDGKQVLSVNYLTKDGQPFDTVKVLSLNEDIVAIGEKISFRMYLSDPELRLVGAYYMDDISDQSLIDTTWVPQDNSVMGVDITTGNPLMIVDDTARIEFRVAGQAGAKTTNRITLISVDREKVFRYHTGRLPYVAK
jgi:hypothetical protein